jgi:hypothetical protein
LRRRLSCVGFIRRVTGGEWCREQRGKTMVDEATCRTMIAAEIDADAANAEASIASGRTRYHGERAQSCLDTLTALARDRWGGDDELHAFPDCLTIFEGTVAPGGACDRSEQCNGGHCASSACVADPKLGEQCDIGACVPELVCLFAPTGSTDPAMCGHPRPDGAQCSYSDECESHYCERNAAGVTVCTTAEAMPWAAAAVATAAAMPSADAAAVLAAAPEALEDRRGAKLAAVPTPPSRPATPIAMRTSLRPARRPPTGPPPSASRSSAAPFRRRPAPFAMRQSKLFMTARGRKRTSAAIPAASINSQLCSVPARRSDRARHHSAVGRSVSEHSRRLRQGSGTRRLMCRRAPLSVRRGDRPIVVKAAQARKLDRK